MSSATMSPAAAFNPFEMTASSGGGEYELCPAGNAPGICVGIVDAGTHEGNYKGKKTERRKGLFFFELPGENKSDGTPFVLVLELSLSFNEKSTLRTTVEAWRGKKFSPDEKFHVLSLLGKPCLVNVAHSTSGDKTYHNIDGISSVLKGMTVPRGHYEPFSYSVTSGEEPPSMDWLPFSYGKSVADVCRASAEWKARTAPAAPANDDDDIPF